MEVRWDIEVRKWEMGAGTAPLLLAPAEGWRGPSGPAGTKTYKWLNFSDIQFIEGYG